MVCDPYLESVHVSLSLPSGCGSGDRRRSHGSPWWGPIDRGEVSGAGSQETATACRSRAITTPRAR